MLRQEIRYIRLLPFYECVWLYIATNNINGIIAVTDYGNNTPHIPAPRPRVNTRASLGISVPPGFGRTAGDSVSSISRARRVKTSRPSSEAHYTDYG
jgi:hypothetical protein